MCVVAGTHNRTTSHCYRTERPLTVSRGRPILDFERMLDFLKPIVNVAEAQTARATRSHSANGSIMETAEVQETVGSWLEATPYCRALGIELVSSSATRCELRLPFNPKNANHTGRLHGGVAASLTAVAGEAVARAALGPSSGPWYTVDVQINYLSAAMAETLIVVANVGQKGRDLCFTDVAIRTEDGRLIAQAVSLVLGRHDPDNRKSHGKVAARLADIPRTGPVLTGHRIRRNPFIAERGMDMTLQDGGLCVVTMPCNPHDVSLDGGIHEGAALSLLDTAGAMACFPLVGRPSERAVTPSIQAQFLARPPAAGIEARAKVVQRDDILFWVDVELGTSEQFAVFAKGTVIYRIVPER